MNFHLCVFLQPLRRVCDLPLAQTPQKQAGPFFSLSILFVTHSSICTENITNVQNFVRKGFLIYILVLIIAPCGNFP